MVNKKSKIKLFQKLENKYIGKVPLRDLLVKSSYLLFLIVIIPILFPTGRSFKYTDLTVGSIASKKVIAPFEFDVLKTDKELNREREEAKNKIPYIFQVNDTSAQIQILAAKEFFNQLAQINARMAKRDKQNKDSFKTDSLKFMDLDDLIETFNKRFRLDLTQDEVALLLSLSNDDKFVEKKNSIIQKLEDLYRLRFIDISKNDVKNQSVSVVQNGIEEDIDFASLIDNSDVPERISFEIRNFKNKALWSKILTTFFEPNLIYSEQLTEQRQQQAVKTVALSKDVVYDNERIIDENERVTDDIYQKLVSLEKATVERSSLGGDLRNVLSLIAKYLLTALILFIFVLYLSSNRPKIFHDTKKLLLLTILIFLQVALGAIIVNALDWSPLVIPTTISSMLMGILFDPGVGLVGTVIIALLLGGITGYDYFFMVLALFVGIIAIYSVTHIRTRNQIFKAILYIASAYFLVNLSFGLLRLEDYQELFRVFLFYMLPNAILSAFITYMTLGLFERMFDITTDITLLELSDLNHSLLKDLSVKAPGTFHHSIIVGNLAEAAAKTIGANSLLARVGSYYHDIGKMVKPEYFVENEQGGENKHKALTPKMSALILASHVKSGLELADEHNIPKMIRDFIPQHHGKNLMTFFYDKAIKSKESTEINESDYRYPGPSPQSKETAIVMLADTIEAAAKTLNNPSTSRLRKLVEELVEKRFLEGELDDSDLTMRDINGIIDGFTSVLQGIYHKRIEYPKQQNSKNGAVKNGTKKENAVKVLNNGNSSAS
jgi:putative nucleotidyltransferase with HDIG domain